MIGALFVLAALVILIVSLLAIVRVGDNRDHRQAQRIMAMRRHPAGKALPISGRSSGGPGEADE